MCALQIFAIWCGNRLPVLQWYSQFHKFQKGYLVRSPRLNWRKGWIHNFSLSIPTCHRNSTDCQSLSHQLFPAGWGMLWDLLMQIFTITSPSLSLWSVSDSTPQNHFKTMLLMRWYHGILTADIFQNDLFLPLTLCGMQALITCRKHPACLLRKHSGR